MAYKIDSHLCVGCEACYQACEFGAVNFYSVEHTCTIDPEKCVECGNCVPECPCDIITLDKEIIKDNIKGSVSEQKAEANKYNKIWIEESECIGCTKCSRNCPEKAITGEKKKPHQIDEDKCIRCGICLDNCPKNAIHGTT